VPVSDFHPLIRTNTTTMRHIMISRSEVQQWTQDDMDNTATHLNDLADKRGSTMDAIQSSASNLNWTGAGNDGKTLAIAGHAATAQTHAQILRATAAIAKAGGQALYGQQQVILTTVQDAVGAGFDVGDDFSVTDPNDPEGFRAGIAAGIEADLTTQAGAFDTQRMTTASGIASASAGLDASSSGNGHVSMVDNHTDKGTPPGQPPIHPDPNQHQEPKKHGFGDVVDSFGKVAGGTLSVLGGTALTVGAIPEEIGSGGLLTPAIIAQGAGGLTLITGGAASVEKGLQELFDDQ
jgi:hypothetical protein